MAGFGISAPCFGLMPLIPGLVSGAQRGFSLHLHPGCALVSERPVQRFMEALPGPWASQNWKAECEWGWGAGGSNLAHLKGRPVGSRCQTQSSLRSWAAGFARAMGFLFLLAFLESLGGQLVSSRPMRQHCPLCPSVFPLNPPPKPDLGLSS